MLEELRIWGCEVDEALSRMLGDETFYITCLKKFVDEPSFGELEKCIQKNYFTDAFGYAHTIKGIAGNLGITPLYDAVSELVDCFRTDTFNKAEKVYARVKREYLTFTYIVTKE